MTLITRGRHFTELGSQSIGKGSGGWRTSCKLPCEIIGTGSPEYIHCDDLARYRASLTCC
eukprot:296271-Rhodomonas_salina.1